MSSYHIPAYDPGTTVQSLAVTENGIYTAQAGEAYSPVTVNVSGGSAFSAPLKDVNFIDYDGTILYSYSASDFASLSAMPSNPTHAGLTSQGWNWTLSGAQSYVATYGKLVIGQMYITTSGKTEIDIVLDDDTLTPYLAFTLNGTVKIDWGDGSSAQTIYGPTYLNLKYTQHTYSSPGSYTISIESISSGAYRFPSDSSCILFSAPGSYNRKYANCIKAIRLGLGIHQYVLQNSFICSAEYITIPSYISPSFLNFEYCPNLKAITLPNLSGIMNYFAGNTSLQFVSLSQEMIGWDTPALDSILEDCRSLKVFCGTTTEQYVVEKSFLGCWGLRHVVIPNSVTHIYSSAFESCRSLESVIIPASVENIGTRAFADCYSVLEYHILPTTPPIINSQAFANIHTDCKFYVPSDSLADYQAASGWSAYASRMIGE